MHFFTQGGAFQPVRKHFVRLVQLTVLWPHKFGNLAITFPWTNEKNASVGKLSTFLRATLCESRNYHGSRNSAFHQILRGHISKKVPEFDEKLKPKHRELPRVQSRQKLTIHQRQLICFEITCYNHWALRTQHLLPDIPLEFGRNLKW